MKKPKQLRSAFFAYKVGEQIGEGGAGRVYQAERGPGDTVAVKLIDASGASGETLARFKNEYHFCSVSRHPNVIHLEDHGLDEAGNPFVVMPLFASSLRPHVGGMKLSAARPLISMLLDGIEAAHLLSVVHRDLKPENVLVSPDLSHLVIADFGIARFTQQDLLTLVETSHGKRLANFQYAAPEQRMKDRAVDHRADIYSVGLILNELFTGELPLATGHPRIGAADPSAAFLDDIVARALRQDPAERYASIADLKNDILASEKMLVARQKLNKLNGEVIRADLPNDPLLATPPNIVDMDWKDDVLTIVLSPKPNERWVGAFRNHHARSYLSGTGPDSFFFTPEGARLNVSGDLARQVVDQVRTWLPAIQQVYARSLEREAEMKEIEAREKLVEERRRAEHRAKVLEQLRGSGAGNA